MQYPTCQKIKNKENVKEVSPENEKKKKKTFCLFIFHFSIVNKVH